MMRLKCRLLGLLIGFLALLAALPIVQLFFPEATALFAGPVMIGIGLVLAALACALAIDANRHRYFMPIGVVAALGAIVLYVVMAVDTLLPGSGPVPVQGLAALNYIAWFIREIAPDLAFAMSMVAMVAGHWAVVSIVAAPGVYLSALRVIVKATAALFAILCVSVLLFQMHALTVATLTGIFTLGVMIAICIVSYLALSARLRHGRWMLHGGAILAAAVFGMLMAASDALSYILLPITFLTFSGIDMQEMVRDLLFVLSWSVIGVTGIFLALAGISALHRREQREAFTRSLLYQLTCPRCESPVQARRGRGRCGTCNLLLHVTAEEPRCVCGYVLSHIGSDRCPECGRSLESQFMPGDGASMQPSAHSP